MMDLDLERLIVRHRHVAPMLSTLLGATHAAVRISDVDGRPILERDAAAIGDERFPISVEGETVGWVEGPRPSASIAAVLSYAASRETDKRALAAEALDRYRELSLIYELAGSLGATLEVDAVASVAAEEAGRLPSGGEGFVVLRDGEDGERLSGGLLGSIMEGDPEIVNDVPSDPRTSEAERGMASVVAAPLQVRGERIGVIGTASSSPVEYKASDLKALSAIAALAAPTLAQAAAHEASLRRR